MGTDFFGNEVDDDFDPFGTSNAVKAPTPAPPGTSTTRDQAALNQIKFENANIKAKQEAPTGTISRTGQFRSESLGPGGTHTAVTPPGQWGQFSYSRQGKDLDAYTAPTKDFGDHFADLTRLGLYVGSAGPLADTVRAYTPQDIGDALTLPQSITDEIGDQTIPGGSGARGGSLTPFLDNFDAIDRFSGADKFYPSETIQSGSYLDGYRGVTNSGNTGIISGLIDDQKGYPFGDMVVDAVGDVIGGIGGGGGVAPVGGGTSPAVDALRSQQDAARQLGMDVLSGEVGGPNPADRDLQMTELERIQQFLNGPREQRNVLSDVDAFLAQPQGPSAAEIQLTQAQDDAMSDALSLARSARGGAGAVNRAMRVAQAENAANQATGARDLALLRAKEEEANRAQILQGLGLKGELAGGLDANTLTALGLGSQTAGDIRGQGLTERGQTLGFTGDMVGGALNSQTDITTAAMRDALERTKLGYELTPDQKLLFASLGAGSDLLSLFL